MARLSLRNLAAHLPLEVTSRDWVNQAELGAMAVEEGGNGPDPY